MSTEEQRIAIAKACGWKYKSPDSNGLVWVIPPEGTPPKKYIPSAPFRPSDVPDYINDLNAMHEAEKTLTNLNSYREFLYLVVLEDKSNTSNEPAWATASQRAEAFLRTLNLWVE